MLDRYILGRLRPLMLPLARPLAAAGVGADQVTYAGFGFGLLAAGLIAAGMPGPAVIALLISRLFDGLDGTVARLGTPTDRGAFLDIVLDFLFYAAVPLAFAVADPAANALAAAVLLAAFIGTGSSFLAYATLAEKRGLVRDDYPTKGFYFLGGLTEGTETILCFVAMCLWPGQFALLAYGFAGLCAVSTATRLIAGWRTLGTGRHD